MADMMSSAQKLAAMFGKGGTPAPVMNAPGAPEVTDTAAASAGPVPDGSGGGMMAPSGGSGFMEALKALAHFFSGPAGAPAGQAGQLGQGQAAREAEEELRRANGEAAVNG